MILDEVTPFAETHCVFVSKNTPFKKSGCAKYHSITENSQYLQACNH